MNLPEKLTRVASKIEALNKTANPNKSLEDLVVDALAKADHEALA